MAKDRIKTENHGKSFSYHFMNYNIRCKLFEWSDIVSVPTFFVEENNIDIISLTKQKRSAFYKIFHSGIMKILLITGKVPMLIFPV